MAEQTSYYSENGRSNVQMTYDSKTDTWVPVTPQNNNATPAAESSSSSSSAAATSASSGGTKSASTIAAEKAIIEGEFNTLTGEMVLTPSKKTIRLEVGTTTNIEGLGKYLSGLYFIKDRKMSVTNGAGLSITLTVIKTGFGASLKPVEAPVETERPAEVVVPEPEFKVGTKVKIVGADAVYSNAHDGVKVPEWVKQKTDMYIQQMSSDGTRALIQPIFSWTYVKFLQQI